MRYLNNNQNVNFLNKKNMQSITIKLQTNLAEKFQTYVKLFGTEELMFDKFIIFHINRLKREIARMQKELDKYEQKYQLKSEKFHDAFEKGKFEDQKDYMLWAGIYELQMDSKNKLGELI